MEEDIETELDAPPIYSAHNSSKRERTSIITVESRDREEDE